MPVPEPTKMIPKGSLRSPASVNVLQRLPITRDLSPSKESNRSCVLVDVNQRKAVRIIFNSDNISRQQNQVIDNFYQG